jgi:uncharacterized membrane protein
MKRIAASLLMMLVVVDTWVRTSIHGEPTAVTVIALVALVAVLALSCTGAVRGVLAAVQRADATRKRPQRRMPAPRREPRWDQECVGGRGARAPGFGAVPAADLC